MLPEFYMTSFVALDPVSSFFVLLTHAAQFTLPLAMLASAELEGVGVRELGGPETITCRAERMIRSWSKLQNGGYGGREQRAFQET